jgi:hypothetical protein
MQLPLVELQLRPTNKFDECSRSGKLLPMNKCDQGDLAGSGAIDAICIRKSAKERWGGRGEVEREREPRVEGGGWSSYAWREQILSANLGEGGGRVEVGDWIVCSEYDSSLW